MILLNEKELKHIISSVVRKLITEEMHVINSSLFKLALFIYQEIDKEIRSGENSIEFVITKEEISKYYPYRNPQPLKIICGLGVSNGKMEYKNGTILVNIEIFYVDGKDRCISRIVHELTHFVNDNEGGIKAPMVPNDKSDYTLLIKRLEYFLNDTEVNSRCSEFGFYLQKEGLFKDIEDYENITHLKEIKNLLRRLEYLNGRPEKQVKRYGKRFIDYKKRIYNIYYHFLSLRLSK